MALNETYHAQARSLILEARGACLATSRDDTPHAAWVSLAWIGASPLLLLSGLALHTRHLLANPACALLLTGQADGSGDAQAAHRLCLTGTAARTDAAPARDCFLAAHPAAVRYVDFGDFAFWRVSLSAARYIAGFGGPQTLDIARLTGGR